MRSARTLPLLLAAATWLGCASNTGFTPAPVAAPTPPPALSPLPEGDRPNFLILAPDTLRGDRVGATRNGAPITPNVDALAARGARFTHMYSQSGWTLPALASLLTGRWPLVGVERDGNPAGYIAVEASTLPRRFERAGYDTAVFWGRSIGEADPAFSEGFAHVGREVGATYEGALLDWLATRAASGAEARPFFALVHNVDLQFPLAPVPGDPLLATAHPAAEQGLEPVLTALEATAGRDAAAASVTAAYDAMVTRYDAAIGRMVEGLGAEAARTVVVVTSNHGVELGERGTFFHGTLADTNLHVPLVVVDPAAQKGLRIDTLVQTVDLAPTLLRRAGLSGGPDDPGQSLLPLLGLDAGDAPYVARDVFSFNSANLVSLRTRTHKLVRMKDPRGGGVRTELFDLSADPFERASLRGPPVAGTEQLPSRLEAWLAGRVAETADGPRQEQEDLERLKTALQYDGYWDVATGATTAGTGGKGGGKEPVPGTGAPPP